MSLNEKNELAANEEKEWKRVMGNPDNVIISDSLIARVDPYNLGEISNPVEVKPVCQFNFEGFSLSGEVISFSNVDMQRSYTFSTNLREASQLMNSANFLSFAMKAGVDEILSMSKEDIKNFNFNVDIQSSTSAVVTITFSEVAE
jgi:hypothetical protein